MDGRALKAWLLPRRRSFRNGAILDSQHVGGFLETLIVIAIVAWLVVFAFEAYRPAIGKAAMTEAANLTAGYKSAIVTELAVRGRLPENIFGLENGLPDGGGKYFSGFVWQDNELVASLSPRFAADIGALSDDSAAETPLTLSFRLAFSEELGRAIFLCGQAAPPPGFVAAPARHTTVPASYLPFFCRV
jgi:type II secretory pathway pseudopilin PulG